MQLDLQVGKKYTVRDPKRSCIKYVEILFIDTDLDRPVQGKVHPVSGRYILADWNLDGFCLSSREESDEDLVAEYVEPVAAPLQLGPEHVGRRVRLRNGVVTLITNYYPGSSLSIMTGSSRYYLTSGKPGYCEDGGHDIIEVLED